MSEPKEYYTNFLIADLSGYTALTEVHGSFSAAAIVTRFLELVHGALKSDVQLIETVGDEVLIISPNAKSILNTAIKLRDLVESEPHFPSIHVGLHGGKVVENKRRYFGTPLNLTSRIASFARGGQILCTKKIIKEIEKIESIRFRTLGEKRFKNITSPVEIFEVIPEQGINDYKILDPVCKMQIDKNTSTARLTFRNKKYYFCSFDCAKIFAENPDNFLNF
jgi:class 3 adenylate cyclase/YHS domain-containing protein